MGSSHYAVGTDESPIWTNVFTVFVDFVLGPAIINSIMDVDSASTFLSCAILTGAGFAIVGIVIIFLNNIFHKYWKPVRIFTPDSWAPFHGITTSNARFVEPHELEKTPPTFDKK